MPEPLNDEIRRRMRRQGRRNTKPELEIRRALHALGYRYRVDVRPEPDVRSRGDIVFTRRKVVVYIDGCFWHGCPIHATAPKNNAQWWREKLDANIERDARNSALLKSRGWSVLRLWEHVPVADAVEQVTDLIRQGDQVRSELATHTPAGEDPSSLLRPVGAPPIHRDDPTEAAT